MDKLTLIVNFDEKFAETTKRIDMETNGLYTTLYNGAFSDRVDTIYIMNHFFIGTKILKAVKVCLVRGIRCIINGSPIDEWNDLRPYQQDIFNFIEDMSAKEETSQVLNIIASDMVLIREYSKGLDEFHEFLDSYIRNSGYDVSLSSASTYDKLSSGTYEDRTGHRVTYSLNYTPTGVTYRTSLLDKLCMYQNIKFYIDNGFEPERVDKDADIVVPISACDLTTQMMLYGD
jgi:hypothetical protein